MSGSEENSVDFICPKYDPEELLVRVEAYNSGNEDQITVEELKESAANGGQALTDYVEWYFEGGDGEIDKYWRELGSILIKYAKEHPEITDRDEEDLNIAQLQELIKKKNDPSYEINIEIMKE